MTLGPRAGFLAAIAPWALVLASVLSGCAGLPPIAERTAADVGLEPNEVAIVINYNAMGGAHAGLIAGGLLSDPAGSYVAARRQSPEWRGLSLADYMQFQLEDGPNVRAYRFRLERKEFAEIEKRVREQSFTAPLFCAATVQSQIAGVGPFAGMATSWWTSPSALGEKLEALLAARLVAGRCEGPKGAPC
jgi:hypothetical protein